MTDKKRHNIKQEGVEVLATYECRCCQKKVAIFCEEHTFFVNFKLSGIWSICYFCYLDEVAKNSSLISNDDYFILGNKYEGYYPDAEFLSGELY